MNNQLATSEIILLSGILDRLSLLLWTKTKDAVKGHNKPKMLVDSFVQKQVTAFNSREEFEKERIRILEGRR